MEEKMAVYLSGSARDRVSGAKGFIDEVTDPSKYLSRMPQTSSDVVSDIGDVKSLVTMLQDQGNPVYVYHKDGSKQFLEYYKGDYELKLVSFISDKKVAFNRIISREEALTMLIDSEYPDMPLAEKLKLASNDTKANMDLVKELWGIKQEEPQELPEEALPEDVYTELGVKGTTQPEYEDFSSYPKLAEASSDTPTYKPKQRTPVFKKRTSNVTVYYDGGEYYADNIIDADTCVVTVSATSDLFDQDPETLCNITVSTNVALTAFYSGVSFRDPANGSTYTIFVKD